VAVFDVLSSNIENDHWAEKEHNGLWH